MLGLCRARQSLRALPAGARMLRTTPARLGMLTTNMPAGGTAVVNPDKFFTGETLVEHQERVRHDNNGFRTHNYAVIGQPHRHRVHWCGVVGLGRTTERCTWRLASFSIPSPPLAPCRAPVAPHRVCGTYELLNPPVHGATRPNPLRPLGQVARGLLAPPWAALLW